MKKTIENNLLAIIYDINSFPNKKLVDFTILSHFLEHVPNILDVRAFITKACKVSKKYVFIRQPYFDCDGLLLQKNLKTYYSDWGGHPNTMSSLQFYMILRNLKDAGIIKHFVIAGRERIQNSNSSRIHDISSPINQHHYDANIHPIKNNNIVFNFELFFEIVILISIDKIHDFHKKFNISKILFTS